MLLSKGVVTMFSIGLFESATSSCFSLRTLIAFAILPLYRASTLLQGDFFSSKADESSTAAAGKITPIYLCVKVLQLEVLSRRKAIGKTEKPFGASTSVDMAVAMVPEACGYVESNLSAGNWRAALQVCEDLEVDLALQESFTPDLMRYKKIQMVLYMIMNDK
jgi:hypothetical protein